MMKMIRLAAALIAATCAWSASAATVQYGAILSGAAEATPNASLGTGTVIVTVDDALKMDIVVNFNGLSGNSTAAHIHCCTAEAGIGTAGVATVTPNFPGFPTGVTSGTYHEVFDLTQASTFNPDFINANGDLAGAFNVFFTGLQSGGAYFNIHSSAYPGGEIRGFLEPVPVPAAAWLFGTAVMGLPLLRRRAQVA